MKNFISVSLIMHVCLAFIISLLAVQRPCIKEAQFIIVADIQIPSLPQEERKSLPTKTAAAAEKKRAEVNIQSIPRGSDNTTAAITQTTKETLPVRTTETEYTNNNTQQQAAVASQTSNQSTAKPLFLPQTQPKSQPTGDIQFGSAAGPAFAHQVQPAYPLMARKLGIGGKVLLRLTIDRTGILQDIKIIENPGYGFAAAAINALNKSRFLPAYHNGKPVQTNALLPIRFAIQK